MSRDQLSFAAMVVGVILTTVLAFLLTALDLLHGTYTP